ncbi:B-cell receptor CD22-like isoform X4 [Oncorhynchus kisutch]|nr:B-cell receptor CD22-like isoform X4 [Oncorhynchus kisutch]XP_031667403.1 B-cell receptor CD22-like isoform X4 [Oncorhynchus kisutch]
MALRTAGSVLVVFLWSVAGVLGQNTVKSVCALKGSSVDMRCPVPSVTQVTEIVWYSTQLNGKLYDLRWDPKYDGRVEYSGTTEKDCILRITDLRQSDIATYHFRYKTNQDSEWKYSYGFTLSLTDLKVERIYDNTLTCSTTCTLTDNPTYIWYKNGQRLDESTSPQYKYSVSSNYDDSYSCAVKGHEDLHSPAVCVQGHNCWRVTYTKRRICALKGSTVDISCSYTHPTSYIEQGSFWFTQKHPVDVRSYPESAGRVEYNRNHHTMTITHLTENDSAEYKFRLKTTNKGRFSGLPGVMLTVTDILLEMDPTSVSEGERVTLRCRTKCTVGLNPTYIWNKNGQRLTNPFTSYNSLILDPVSSYNSLILDPVSSYNSLILDPVSSEDAGNYSCTVEGLERILSPEETLTVRYRPKNTSVSVSPSGGIVEGSSVTLTCSSDANPPVQSYTWYKKNGGDYQSMTGPQHVFNQIQSSDSGEYYCVSQNEMGKDRSRTINMDVKYSPKNPSVSVSPSGEIVEGSSVTLTCSSDANPPVDKYTWYKKNVTSPKASGQSYSITNISSEDRGEYYCEAENKYGRLNSSSVFVDVQYGPKNISVSVSPSGEIVEGSSVTLTCSSDANPPVDKYTWYFQNETFLNGCGQMYNISNFKSKDSGHYHCEAWNRRGSRNSTALMIIIPGKQTSVLTTAVGIIVVVLVLILCLSGLMWFRKKASTSTSDTRDTSENVQGDSSPVYENVSSMSTAPTAAQTESTVDQDDVHYASVHFSRSKNQEVPLYSTVQVSQPQKQEEDVQYDAVKFKLPSAATRPTAAQAAEEDSSEIYSRVNKPRRPEHNKPRTKKT